MARTPHTPEFIWNGKDESALRDLPPGRYVLAEPLDAANANGQSAGWSAYGGPALTAEQLEDAQIALDEFDRDGGLTEEEFWAKHGGRPSAAVRR